MLDKFYKSSRFTKLKIFDKSSNCRNLTKARDPKCSKYSTKFGVLKSSKYSTNFWVLDRSNRYLTKAWTQKTQNIRQQFKLKHEQLKA